jgi:lipoate-protein ligase A
LTHRGAESSAWMAALRVLLRKTFRDPHLALPSCRRLLAHRRSVLLGRRQAAPVGGAALVVQ